MPDASRTRVETPLYPAEFEQIDGEIIVRFPDLPEILTSGDDEASAERAAEDALEEALLARLANGQAVPMPSPPTGAQRAILLDPVTAGRVLVDWKRRARALSKVQLAQLMGRDEKVVRRLLDGRGGVSMDTVLDALRALGHRATLSWR